MTDSRSVCSTVVKIYRWSDVHSDLKRLETLGILELKEGGPGGAMQPVVPFDRIEMHIDYPLVGDVDGDEASISA